MNWMRRTIRPCESVMPTVNFQGFITGILNEEVISHCIFFISSDGIIPLPASTISSPSTNTLQGSCGASILGSNLQLFWIEVIFLLINFWLMMYQKSPNRLYTCSIELELTRRAVLATTFHDDYGILSARRGTSSINTAVSCRKLAI